MLQTCNCLTCMCNCLTRPFADQYPSMSPGSMHMPTPVKICHQSLDIPSCSDAFVRFTLKKNQKGSCSAVHKEAPLLVLGSGRRPGTHQYQAPQASTSTMLGCLTHCTSADASMFFSLLHAFEASFALTVWRSGKFNFQSILRDFSSRSQQSTNGLPNKKSQILHLAPNIDTDK